MICPSPIREIAMSIERDTELQQGTDVIRLNSAAPPVDLPVGYLGPVVLPGSGRLIYWTGRVAIGLRHQPQQEFDMPSQSALWVQDLLLHRKAA
jgi:hypothetical protein